MNKVLRFLIVSFLIWLIPFVVSIPFFDRTGQLTVNFWVFKTIMLIVLSASAFYLFRWCYRTSGLRHRHWTTYALLGLGTFAINVVLDAFTIIPLTNITPTQYVAQVASFYLLIVAISVYTGISGTQSTEKV